MRRHLFWPPSIAYISIIITHILHITNVLPCFGHHINFKLGRFITQPPPPLPYKSTITKKRNGSKKHTTRRGFTYSIHVLLFFNRLKERGVSTAIRSLDLPNSNSCMNPPDHGVLPASTSFEKWFSENSRDGAKFAELNLLQ